jgi:hypothetical protein
MARIRNDEVEESLAIESIAAEFHLPIVEVRHTYERQLARLKSAARVPQFVTLFALRSTREALQAGR